MNDCSLAFDRGLASSSACYLDDDTFGTVDCDGRDFIPSTIVLSGNEIHVGGELRPDNTDPILLEIAKIVGSISSDSVEELRYRGLELPKIMFHDGNAVIEASGRRRQSSSSVKELVLVLLQKLTSFSEDCTGESFPIISLAVPVHFTLFQRNLIASCDLRMRLISDSCSALLSISRRIPCLTNQKVLVLNLSESCLDLSVVKLSKDSLP
ncbi:hypothetical protein RCL1_008203 [Eukaryota sp. TZLM3-RCL]